MPEPFRTKDIIGHCNYWKNAIYDGDPYIVFEGDTYHLDCYNQMNTFYDPFDTKNQ